MSEEKGKGNGSAQGEGSSAKKALHFASTPARNMISPSSVESPVCASQSTLQILDVTSFMLLVCIYLFAQLTDTYNVWLCAATEGGGEGASAASKSTACK